MTPETDAPKGEERPTQGGQQGGQQATDQYATNLPAPPGTNPDPVVIG